MSNVLRVFSAIAAILVTFVAGAAHAAKPVRPPTDPAPGPLTVIDAEGTTVGRFREYGNNKFGVFLVVAGQSVYLPLTMRADYDFDAEGNYLSTFRQNPALLVWDVYFSHGERRYYTTEDCTGEAFVQFSEVAGSPRVTLETDGSRVYALFGPTGLQPAQREIKTLDNLESGLGCSPFTATPPVPTPTVLNPAVSNPTFTYHRVESTVDITDMFVAPFSLK